MPEADCKQAIEQKVADGMNQLLQGVMKFGTGARAALNRVSAGKTGTTDSRYNVWFVGYVPQLATAVWAGNPSPPAGGYPLVNREIGGRFYGNVCGGCLPGPIWQQTMNNALAGTPVKGFATAPSDVVMGKPKPVPGVSGMSPGDAKATLRAAGFVPVVAKRRVFVDYAKAGTVAYTSPGRGQDAYLGQTVTVYISGGAFTGPSPGGGGGGGGGGGPGKPQRCPPTCDPPR